MKKPTLFQIAMRQWWFDAALTVLFMAGMFVIALAVDGCHAIPKIVAPPPPWYEPWKNPGTSDVTGTLNFWLGFGVFGLAVAGGLAYFLAPAHRLSLSIAIGSGILIGTSLFLKTVLPWIPLVGGIGAVAAIGILGYELYVKFKRNGNATTKN